MWCSQTPQIWLIVGKHAFRFIPVHRKHDAGKIIKPKGECQLTKYFQGTWHVRGTSISYRVHSGYKRLCALRWVNAWTRSLILFGTQLTLHGKQCSERPGVCQNRRLHLDQKEPTFWKANKISCSPHHSVPSPARQEKYFTLSGSTHA